MNEREEYEARALYDGPKRYKVCGCRADGRTLCETHLTALQAAAWQLVDHLNGASVYLQSRQELVDRLAALLPSQD